MRMGHAVFQRLLRIPDDEICIRAGRPGVVAVNLNGFDLGNLGSGGQPGSWLILPGGTPVPTEDQCLPTE